MSLATFMNRDRFEELVAEALDGLPADIRQHIDNVAITVADWPSPFELARSGRRSPYELLGLYQGVPLTRRGQGYNLIPPDQIILFRGPILAISRTPLEARHIIERTVVHEIAHHFGLSDERLRELGY